MPGTLIVRQQKEVGKKFILNPKQDMFCKVFATDQNCLANGKLSYKKVYGEHLSDDVASASSGRFLMDSRFTARINEYLERDGFNNETVDAHHLFLIKQKKDMGVSMKGIQEYNKLKKRVTNQIELIMPTPLAPLDDDEVIVKIDKSKVRDIEISQNDAQV